MKKCKHCKSDIDKGASRCPHCQSDQRGWFARHKILSAILVVLLIGGVIGALGGNGDKKDNPSVNNPKIVTAESETKPAPTPEKISIKDLADDFDNNKVAAETKWKDKLVEFSAPISNITDMGISFSNIASKQFSLTQVSCRIKDKQQLLPLKNGQTVTVQGVVGTQTIGVIDFSNCEVVQ